MTSLNETTTHKLLTAILEKDWIADAAKTKASSGELRQFIMSLMIDAPAALGGIEKTDLLLVDYRLLFHNLQGKAVWYSVTELADMFGKHRISVYRWIKAGDLKAKKIGGEWLVSQNDLNEYIDMRQSNE